MPTMTAPSQLRASAMHGVRRISVLARFASTIVPRIQLIEPKNSATSALAGLR